VGDVDVDICMYMLVSFTNILLIYVWGSRGFELARVGEREDKGGV
jgi:hypothetical protein